MHTFDSRCTRGACGPEVQTWCTWTCSAKVVQVDLRCKSGACGLQVQSGACGLSMAVRSRPMQNVWQSRQRADPICCGANLVGFCAGLDFDTERLCTCTCQSAQVCMSPNVSGVLGTRVQVTTCIVQGGPQRAREARHPVESWPLMCVAEFGLVPMCRLLSWAAA